MIKSVKVSWKELATNEVALGLLLLLATAGALFWANSPWQAGYESFWNIQVGLSFRDVVNEILMTFFFFSVGAEIKRERLEGELTSLPQVRLPLLAAIGGMIAPAVVFLSVNFILDPFFTLDHSAIKGWAIPTATDIAFSLGIFSFLGRRVPLSLRSFLLVLAIADDLGAVILIALFYAKGLSGAGLGAAALVCLLLLEMKRRRIESLSVYALVGALLWASVLSSGLHAPLAGLLVAFMLPLKARKSEPLKKAEKAIHPWVTLLVMPLFAFANAGVSLSGTGAGERASPLLLSLALALFVGKPLGVTLATWLMVRAKLARLPRGATWFQFIGLAVLCGIGFTMSLLIGVLAFPDGAHHFDVRAGILLGSALAALVGSAMLYYASRPSASGAQ